MKDIIQFMQYAFLEHATQVLAAMQQSAVYMPAQACYMHKYASANYCPLADAATQELKQLCSAVRYKAVLLFMQRSSLYTADAYTQQMMADNA